DVTERTLKTGHVSEALVSVVDGVLQQHGQAIEAIQANNLLFGMTLPQVRARSEAEVHNAFRTEQYYRQGLLEDYALVVVSRAADDMSLRDMQRASFFTDTMSLSIQVTTATENGLVVESAFVSGVKEYGGERNDAEKVARLGEYLGVDWSGSATETLASPVLVHKSLIPNLAIDIVEMYDNGETFFGEDRPAEDYLAYREKCRERERDFEPTVQAISDALISESLTIASPPQAVQRLHKLSGQHMIEQAIVDESIDARVFGPKSAAHIVTARAHHRNGDHVHAAHEVKQAQKSDQSSSCPGTPAGDETERDGDAGDENCEFISKKCPQCGRENVRTWSNKVMVRGECGCFILK
ncbi:MAG: hypothetical protein ACREGB_03725, partial [Candidatus Saccharimonadales bacterium]